MLYIIIYILSFLQLVGLIILALQLHAVSKQLLTNRNQLTVQPTPNEPVYNAPAPATEVDDKATNAERLYMEGIQSIFSYDVNTMKQYLKGVDEE